MTLADFTKQPRGPYAFDFWIANQVIPTPMGDFTIELQMDIGDKMPPTPEMLRMVDELVRQFREDIEPIHDLVFEHYQTIAEDGGWLGSCGVPRGLDRSEILERLHVRSLTVAHDESTDEGSISRVYIVPEWDEEHAIYLAFENGAWEFVDS